MNDNYDFNGFNINSFQMNNSYWTHYNSMIQDMSSEQRLFVSKQDSVIEAKQNLMAAFIDYLFEREKTSFVNSGEDYKKISDKYLDSVKEAADRYVTRNEQLEKENIELKKQLKQLMLDFEGKSNDSDKCTTKRT